MDQRDSPRAPYGAVLLVALGWYVTLVAGVAVGLAGAPGSTCPPHAGGFSLCGVTPLEAFALVTLLYGVQVLVVVLGATLVVGAAVRFVAPGSSILAGTLTAGTTVLVLGGGLLVLAGSR